MLIPRVAGAVSAGTAMDIPSRPNMPQGFSTFQAGVQYRHPPETIIGAARGLPGGLAADAEGKAGRGAEYLLSRPAAALSRASGSCW